jgi:hypothetical protein
MTIFYSHLRLPQSGGPGPRIYIPQEEDGPVIPPGTRFPFRRLLRLAGLRWRYSNPPLFGQLLLIATALNYIPILTTDHREDIPSNSSSSVASRGHHQKRTKNITSLLLLYWPLPSKGRCTVTSFEVAVQQRVTIHISVNSSCNGHEYDVIGI